MSKKPKTKTYRVYKKLPKLDPAEVRHSVASEDDERIYQLEKVEGEVFELARYCVRKAKILKGDPIAVAHLSRIGKTIQNLKMVHSLGTGTYQDLYAMKKAIKE
jgi:hypothetical protein